MCFSPQRRAIFRHLNFKKCSETVSFLTFWVGNVLLATAACNFSWSEAEVFWTFWLQNVLLATAACHFRTSQLQKVLRTPEFFSIFISKCASRHSGVQFFNISTSKSGPNLTCFVHFHFKMCFSPQRRAIFQHLNFMISPLTTWLRTRRFNEPTFRLTRHTNHWKNTAFRDFSSIWRGWIFFLLTFALLQLLSSDSTSPSDFTFFWLYFIYLLFICFSTLHIVGSLLFKLPSNIAYMATWIKTLQSPFMEGKIKLAKCLNAWTMSNPTSTAQYTSRRTEAFSRSESNWTFSLHTIVEWSFPVEWIIFANIPIFRSFGSYVKLGIRYT